MRFALALVSSIWMRKVVPSQSYQTGVVSGGRPSARGIESTATRRSRKKRSSVAWSIIAEAS
jgi:hypothetical protein